MKADFARPAYEQTASDVDRYDGDRSPEEIAQVTTYPNDYERNDIERLAKRHKGQPHDYPIPPESNMATRKVHQ